MTVASRWCGGSAQDRRNLCDGDTAKLSVTWREPRLLPYVELGVGTFLGDITMRALIIAASLLGAAPVASAAEPEPLPAPAAPGVVVNATTSDTSVPIDAAKSRPSPRISCAFARRAGPTCFHRPAPSRARLP